MEGSAVTTTQVLIDNNQLGKLWTLGEASRNISSIDKVPRQLGRCLSKDQLTQYKISEFYFQ